MNIDRFNSETCADDERALTIEQMTNMRRYDAWLIRRAEHETGVNLSGSYEKIYLFETLKEGLVFGSLIALVIFVGMAW